MTYLIIIADISSIIIAVATIYIFLLSHRIKRISFSNFIYGYDDTNAYHEVTLSNTSLKDITIYSIHLINHTSGDSLLTYTYDQNENKSIHILHKLSELVFISKGHTDLPNIYIESNLSCIIGIRNADHFISYMQIKQFNTLQDQIISFLKVFIFGYNKYKARMSLVIYIHYKYFDLLEKLNIYNASEINTGEEKLHQMKFKFIDDAINKND